VVGALLLQQCVAKCSVAEQKCGGLCCCVTCQCIEGPYRCQSQISGQLEEPVGTETDGRYTSARYRFARFEDDLARNREFSQEHQERARRRRDQLSPRRDPAASIIEDDDADAAPQHHGRDDTSWKLERDRRRAEKKRARATLRWERLTAVAQVQRTEL
jgi:hypothetical protein